MVNWAGGLGISVASLCSDALNASILKIYSCLILHGINGTLYSQFCFFTIKYFFFWFNSFLPKDMTGFSSQGSPLG